ncbi:MAG: TetR/AcrR family transcriptional regulator [Actinomycetota bacterium]|nr:TetR/AcrR family transcriptional regulator [Actinomycetota bacterium]
MGQAKGSSPKRGGRPRAGQEALSRGRILDAALRLVDEEGMGALSMRRLGAELGVNPMSIYHHLPGKGAVISGLVELVFSGMRVRYSDGSPWQDQVRAWAETYRDLVRSHPNLVLEIVSSAAAVTEAVLLVNEPLYAALDEAGLPPAEVVVVADSVVDFIHGFAIAEGAQPPGHPFDRRELLERLETGAANILPTMRRVFRALTADEARYDFDRGFDAGLSILLMGIEASAVDADHFGEDPL